MTALAGKPSPQALSIPQAHPRLWWTPARLARARKWCADNSFTPTEIWGYALCYVVNGDKKAGKTAVAALLEFTVPEAQLKGVASDVYRWTDWVPVVYDWCHAAMTEAQRKDVVKRYNTYVNILRQKDWGGPGMPGSNYFWGYFRNELNWAIATYYENPMAKTFLDFALQKRWRESFVPYAREAGAGGAPPEGSAYGQVMLSYPLVPLVTLRLLGQDPFAETNWFREAVYWLIHATTPAPTYRKGDPNPYYQLFPFGEDESGGGYPPVGQRPYLGDFLETTATEWSDRPVGRYARTWVNQVAAPRSCYVSAVSQGDKEGDWASLPLDYYAPGPRFLYSRNQWGPQATVVLLQLGRPGGSSYLHADAGTFQIWRNGRWLSKETTGYVLQFNGGSSNDTIAHNGLLLGGKGMARAWQEGEPEVLRLQCTPAFSYACVDLSKTYRASRDGNPVAEYDNPSAVHVVREFLFLRELETLVILDRVQTSAKDVDRTFLLHFPEEPAADEAGFLGVNEDQALRVISLLPAGVKHEVVDEGNFEGKHDAASYYQFRLELHHQGMVEGYFLNVLQGRDTNEADIKARLTEDKNLWTIRLEHPQRGQAMVVLNKGMNSAGGSVNGVPLLHRVQAIAVGEKGPAWGK
jgi:hypothetical protein